MLHSAFVMGTGFLPGPVGAVGTGLIDGEFTYIETGNVKTAVIQGGTTAGIGLLFGKAGHFLGGPLSGVLASRLSSGVAKALAGAESKAAATSLHSQNEPIGEELYRLGHPIAPMENSMDYMLNKDLYLSDVAKKYGINLRGVEIVYDPTIVGLGVTREIEGGNIIRIGHLGMLTEADAANTIAHELSHARDFRRGAGTLEMNHDPLLHKPESGAVASGNALEEYIRGKR